jgi:hypothetical protein
VGYFGVEEVKIPRELWSSWTVFGQCSELPLHCFDPSRPKKPPQKAENPARTGPIRAKTFLSSQKDEFVPRAVPSGPIWTVRSASRRRRRPVRNQRCLKVKKCSNFVSYGMPSSCTLDFGIDIMVLIANDRDANQKPKGC